MDSKIVAVIGAGNGGQALAAYFALAGCEVRIFDYFEKPINILKEKGEIQLVGAIEGKGKLAMASNNLEEVIVGADLIMVVNPALYHRKIAIECAPYIKDDQLIFLHPSSVFGAFAFKKALEDAGCHKKVVIAESHSLLFACRLIETGKVNIGGVKDRLLVAAFPACEGKKMYDILKPVIPVLDICETVLVTSFESTNAMVHPLPTMMNVSWAESGNKFRYYWDGIGETVGHFIEEMDQERVNIGKALGLTLGKDLFDGLMEYEGDYGVTGDTLSQVVKKVEAYKDIYAANTARTRYIYEDVPTGLVPFIAMGEVLGLPVTKMKLVQNLCEAMLEEDFQNAECARNLENIGISGMTADQIVNYAKTGVK